LYQGKIVRPFVHGTINGIPHGFRDVAQAAKKPFYQVARGFFDYPNVSAFTVALIATAAFWYYRLWEVRQNGTYRPFEADDLLSEPMMFFGIVAVLAVLHSVAQYSFNFFTKRKLNPPADLLV
jgi:hypothetical protein